MAGVVSDEESSVESDEEPDRTSGSPAPSAPDTGDDESAEEPSIKPLPGEEGLAVRLLNECFDVEHFRRNVALMLFQKEC